MQTKIVVYDAWGSVGRGSTQPALGLEFSVIVSKWASDEWLQVSVLCFSRAAAMLEVCGVVHEAGKKNQ